MRYLCCKWKNLRKLSRVARNLLTVCSSCHIHALEENGPVLSRGVFWMIWRCHSIPCFHFYFLFRNNGIRENYIRTTSAAVMVKFVLKVSFASTWSQLCLKFFLNSYKTPWQGHMKDTLQLKVLPTWINVGVVPAPRHLTYCSMLFSLSLSLSQTNLVFVFQPEPSPFIFHKTLVLVNRENYWFSWYQIFTWYHMPILCILDETFGVRFWPLLNWCSMYISCNFL